MKRNLFIGSSSEGLSIARRVKLHLDPHFEVDVWTEADFAIGNSFLDSLIESSRFYDFGIFIGTPDDKTISRNNILNVQRDNVTFEYGLFLGSLGKYRSFAIIEQSVNLPSDLAGVNLLRYDQGAESTVYNSLEKRLEQLSDLLRRESTNSRYQMLPSTALAIGYFDAAVKRISDLITYSESVVVGETEYKPVRFTVVIPDNLKGEISSKRQRLISTLRTSTLTFTPNERRQRDIYVDCIIRPGNSLHIYDLPTTLGGIDKAIAVLFAGQTVNVTRKQRLVEQRELANFRSVLLALVEDSDYSDFVELVWMDELLGSLKT